MGSFISITIAFKELGRNKTRAALTMLGIIIGVAAVITMLSLGEGANAEIQQQISSLGTNVMIILPGSTTQGGVRAGHGSATTLTYDDCLVIQNECPAVRLTAPGVRTVAQAVSATQNWSTLIQGSTPAMFDIRDWELRSGEYFTQEDVDGATNVCLIGQTAAENLFGLQNPVGQVIRIKNIPFRILGLLEEKGQTASGMNQDDVIVVPFTTVQRKIMGVTYISIILVAARSSADEQKAIDQIKALLRQRHRIQAGQDDDFSIRSLSDISSAAAEASKTMTILLASIASVSLIVGGIGIMNIMLVSVTERTREIGIRIAVGARSRDILLQFLIEALVLSIIGGLIGIGIGIASSKAITYFAGWKTVISLSAIILSFSFAAAVGIFFGFYPARRASLLEPIEALRYE
ncbi:MAG: ABC transporter permease [Acidobacteriota bacterium]